MVEVIISLVIIVILAAIAIPVTLSIIKSSNEAEIAMDAKNIWSAVQTKFLDLQSRDEHWQSDNAGMGIIINQGSPKIGGGKASFAKGDFKGAFIDISNLKVSESILSNIESQKNIETLYVCAGKYYQYYTKDSIDYAYTVYLIVYKYNDSDIVYVYDGKNVTNEWPLTDPKSVNAFDIKKTDLKLNDIYVQFYRLKKKSGAGDPNSEFKSFFS